ncbi:MAG: hypothetical protein QXN34_06845 [Archaeoglobaceae archaeon]
MSANISIYIKAFDEASKEVESVAEATSNALKQIENSTKNVAEATEISWKETKQAITTFSQFATSAFALYSIIDNLADSQINLQRAQLLVHQSLKALEDAQKRYNDAVEKYGEASPQAEEALKNLQLAQERYNYALEKAELIQSNFVEQGIKAAIMVIPTFVSLIDSVVKAKEAWVVVQHALNAAMAANPIGLIITAIGALISILVIAYQTCEPFRNAVNEVGRVLSEYLKPIIDAIVGGLQWLANAFLDAGNKIAGFFGWVKTNCENFFAGVQLAFSVFAGETEQLVNQWAEKQIATIEDRYNAEIERTTSHYENLIAEVNSWLNEQTQAVESEYSMQVQTINQKYDEIIQSTIRFYDEQIAAINEGLRKIREMRDEDLKHLELNYLLQKQALREMLESNQITTEEYNARLNELEKTYREQRMRISEEYRLKELQAEFDAKEKIRALEEAKREEIEQINVERSAELWQIEKEKNAKIEQLTTEANARIAAIEEQKRAEINNLIATKELEKQKIIEERQQMIEKVQNSWLNRLGESFRNAWDNFVNWARSGWDRITSTISDAVNRCGDWLSGFGQSVGKTLSDAWGSIMNFINNICFAHAIGEAVESAEHDLNRFVNIVDESMNRAYGEIRGFNMGLGGLGMSVPAPPAAGALNVNINAPLVYVEGSADEKTVRKAVEELERRLKTVLIEASSTAAPTKRIRLAGGII